MTRTRAIVLLCAGLLTIGGVFIYATYGTVLRSIVATMWPAPAVEVEEKGLAVVGVTVPEGFRLTLYAADVPGARVIVHDPYGNLVVSQTKQGSVSVLLPDGDGDGAADGVRTLVTGLNNPHGLAFFEEEGTHYLYIAETEKISRYIYANPPVTLGSGEVAHTLPPGGRHVTRTLLRAPDPSHGTPQEVEDLFISTGSSCDVCAEEEEQIAAVLRADMTEGTLEVYAKGLRNSVFMTLHPVTGKIWATEMGRDWLGDDLPPDEVNIIEKDKQYGWPICYGKNVHDTEYDKNTYIRNPCMEPFETPSHIDLPAHVAPLGLAFIPEEGWPEEWWHHLLVAYHGSWNSADPVGYRIVRIPLDAKGAQRSAPVDFVTGFLKEDGTIAGRPVDILLEPGGTGYITDDHAGVVYRLVRTGE